MSPHTYRRPASVDLPASVGLPASVDPVGVKQEPPMVLKPSTSLQKWTPEIIRGVMSLDPLTTLPRSLIPTRKFRLRPPTMRYGWKVNKPILLEYAERHNVTHRYEPVRFPRLLVAGDVDDDGFEDEYDDDDDDDEGLSSDELMTLKQAVWHIVDELDLPRLERLITVTWVLTRDPEWVISIYTNYDLAIAPSEDDVEKLRQALGEAEKPVWYLDSGDFKWRSWNY